MVAEGVEEVKEQSAQGNDDAFDEEWQQLLEAGELTLEGQPEAEVPTLLYQQPLAQEKEDAPRAGGEVHVTSTTLAEYGGLVEHGKVRQPITFTVP